MNYRLAAGLYLLALYLSSAYLREISNFLRQNAALSLTVNAALGLGGAALVYFYRHRWRTLTPACAAGLLVLAAGGVLAARGLPLPEERFHLVQYGLLAWLLTQGLRSEMDGARLHAASFLLTALAGTVDEIIQGILPNRVGSLRDVGLNALSAALAQGAFALLEAPRKRNARFAAIGLLAALAFCPTVRADDEPWNWDAAERPAAGPGPRDAAPGTSPSTENQPLLGRAGPWEFRLEGQIHAARTRQGDRRGGDKFFNASHLSLEARRPFDRWTLAARAGASLEPLMGRDGYPLLLASGGSADGKNLLVDRQHPHDAATELALAARWAASENAAVETYVGWPGAPALGPPAAAHRDSGRENPEALIGHHALESAHTSYGVVTLGLVWKKWTLEGSAFKGREPDEDHGDLESFKLDSGAAQLRWAPSARWEFQTGYGFINSPERLFPSADTRRATAGLAHRASLGRARADLTLAAGRDWHGGFDTLDATLAEINVAFGRPSVFGRFEWVEKDDLLNLTELRALAAAPALHPFHNVPSVPNRVFGLRKLSLGGVVDLIQGAHARWGLGAVGGFLFLPQDLQRFYGRRPTTLTVFLRVRLG